MSGASDAPDTPDAAAPSHHRPPERARGPARDPARGSPPDPSPQDRSHKRTGRPRSARADRAILAAAREALAELGWSGLALGDVAARAGVAKTTLYRRWAGKNELAVDALAALFDEQLELPDRGSLEADIEGAVLRFAALLDRPETRTALMAVVAEAGQDEALRTRIRESLVERQKHLVRLGRERAQRRGEMAPDEGAPDPARDDLVFDVVAGAVVHRMTVSSEPVDPAWAARLARLLVHGLGSAGRR
ncbi:TetR/AcrR family transcriptional regulator [Actinacidiphila yeochonensis]|uniref:TetR/AcrR family transcriptional regulator n=1 Tax=Actinacidiphila yeochonensis TaxID=89050 RepID=UPI00099E03AB|nr:TetR/AcrR family transcriptional regulator [Actinacidiphila yeochonensis]